MGYEGGNKALQLLSNGLNILKHLILLGWINASSTTWEWLDGRIKSHG